MEKGNVVSLEDRIPKLKHRRKKRANRRAIMLLVLFFILLILVLYFLSPLSDINKIDNDIIAEQILSCDIFESGFDELSIGIVQFKK